MSTKRIGEKLRKLRMENKLPLRKVAALIDIDVAILSKMERGQRRLTKEIVKKLCKIYKHDLDELMILFLSEKVMYEIGNEKLALQALHVAEQQVEYNVIAKPTQQSILKSLISYFVKDKRIKSAWIFGSFARGDDHYNSDIDLMVSFDKKQKISFFDLADIAHKIEQIVKRKIDLVEEGCLKPFAYENAKNDLKKIYG